VKRINLNAILINVFVMAPFAVLGPAVAKASLGGAGAWALIIASEGAGSIAGSLLGVRLRVRRRLSLGLAVGVLWAPALAMLALQLPAAAIAPLAFLAGVAVPIRFTCFQTTFHELVPPELLSRLSSFASLGSIAFAPLDFALTGLIATHLLDIEGTLWLAAAVAVAASLGIAAAPSVRTIEATSKGHPGRHRPETDTSTGANPAPP
jgi:hypothetical protein